MTQWQQSVPEEAFDLVTVNATGYQIWSAIGRLSSGHSVRLIMNGVIGQEQWRYLVCTDLALTPQAILSYYLERWEVENFYRVAKQSLGWGDYQMREMHDFSKGGNPCLSECADMCELLSCSWAC